MAKIHFMVLAILKFQNVNWFIRNTDFPANRCWNISNVFRPKTPPTTPRSFIWNINFDGPKWKNYKLFFYMLVNLIIDQINWKHWCDINLYKFVISFFQKNGGYHPCHSEHWEKCRFLGISDFWDKCRIRDLCSDLLRYSVVEHLIFT